VSNSQINPLAVLEFRKAGLKLLWWRINPMVRRMSKEQQTQELNELLDELSDTTLSTYLSVILPFVNTSKAECRKYTSSSVQFKAIAERLPRLGHYQGRVIDHIKKARRKAGLR
jgi:hypothetical protein